MRSLRQVLIEQGANVDGWRLSEASGISDDGTTIAGHGQVWNESTQSWGAAQGFVATINVGPAVVEIDVQPYDENNFVKTNGLYGNLMQVAIEGSADFNVTQVDTTTVKFGPANAEVHSVVPGMVDTNADGFGDLRVKFSIADTGLTCDYVDDVTLTGSTIGGAGFEGSDSVTTTNCDLAGCHP